MSADGYDKLVPNIAQVRVDGAQVQVSWMCPNTGRDLGQTTAYMVADGSLTGRVQTSMKRSVASEVIYGAARLLTGLLGGVAGRVVSNAVYTAAGDLNSRVYAGTEYTEASRRAAIVTAFESVKASVIWDEPSRRYVAK
jgi:hypothetical protein